MKFKAIILSFCLALVSTFAFAGDNVNATETPAIEIVSTTVVLDAEGNEASCTVTGTVSVLGQKLTVSATAETCAEALAMVKKTLS